MTLPQADKYLFCVSPGRSGTHYLYHVLSCVHDVCAVHEPEHEYPHYARLKPQLWDLKNRPFSDSLAERRDLKLSQISDLLSNNPASVYAETNPLFSTLWHDTLLGELSGKEIIVVILRRNATEVLKSLLDLGWFNTRDGNDWMVSAYSVNSLIQPLSPEQQSTPFDLLSGYLLNVEMYAQRIKRLCQQHGHTVIELHSNQMFGNHVFIMDLLDQCGLRPDTEKLSAVLKKKKNKPPTKKKSFDVPLEICARELKNYLRRCEDCGIDIPELPYI